MNKDYLLNNEIGKKLYFEYAKDMPIYDYHCHLPIKEIYENRHFENITKLWLVDGNFGDHYKWRALRNNGVSEKYITGDADDYLKFMEWAKLVPYLIGNPLYSWTNMELKEFFNIDEMLNENNAHEYYTKMNEFLKSHGARDIINMMNVDTICTTDDPIDDLYYHQELRKDKSFKTNVYPAFRPDKVINIDWNTFVPYVNKLSEVVNFKIDSISNLEEALAIRVKYFNDNYCRVSDHALDVVMYKQTTKEEVNDILIKALNGLELNEDEIAKYRGYIVCYLGRLYHKYNWVQQYHIKALRNNNSRMMKEIGPDTGFDSINDGCIALPLSKILDNLDSTNELPKTILYSLNPCDNELLATLAFTHTEENIKGKMQLGSAWWFNDQKDGIIKQLKALSNLGLLSNFIGMLTDSRSFLSYVRHDYFRRILCNYIGELVIDGEYPNDIEFLGKIVKDICFNNAKKYFDN